MSGDLMQQLTEQIVWRVADVRGWPDWMQAPCLGRDQKPIVARVLEAALASGLVVPTSDVLNLAQQHARRGPQLTDGVTVAAELRALTQQEPR